ncbi:iron ABC transporter, partial [Bacillus safensis]
INQPLRILSSHKKNGGFFWKRSIGTGTKTLHEQLESDEDMLFFEQSNRLAQFAAEDAEDDMILYGMLQQEALTIWLILKRSLADGAAVQLMGQLMHIIKQETSYPIHHLCIASPNTQETEDADHLHERLGQKVQGLLHTLNVIQK